MTQRVFLDQQQEEETNCNNLNVEGEETGEESTKKEDDKDETELVY